MALKLSFEILEVSTRHRFTIARGSSDTYRRVWVRLTDGDGAEGWGEADPSWYYGETADTVVTALRRLEPVLPSGPFDLENAESAMLRTLGGNPAARAAVSAALHDLAGKRLGAPLWQLWGLDPSKAPLSSFTIGLDTPEVVRAKVREAAPYPILKIKVGTPDDEVMLRAVREVTDKPLRVDANAGWTPKQAIARLPLLEEMGVELIEQPVAPGDLEGLAAVHSASQSGSRRPLARLPSGVAEFWPHSLRPYSQRGFGRRYGPKASSRVMPNRPRDCSIQYPLIVWP